jgi:hypothetical protein
LEKVYHCPREPFCRQCCANRRMVTYFSVIKQFQERFEVSLFFYDRSV